MTAVNAQLCAEALRRILPAHAFTRVDDETVNASSMVVRQTADVFAAQEPGIVTVAFLEAYRGFWRCVVIADNTIGAGEGDTIDDALNAAIVNIDEEVYPVSVVEEEWPILFQPDLS